MQTKLSKNCTVAPEWKQIKQYTTYQRPCFQRGLLYNYKILESHWVFNAFVYLIRRQSVSSFGIPETGNSMKHAFSLQLQPYTQRKRYATYRIESSIRV